MGRTRRGCGGGRRRTEQDQLVQEVDQTTAWLVTPVTGSRLKLGEVRLECHKALLLAIPAETRRRRRRKCGYLLRHQVTQHVHVFLHEEAPVS